MKPLFAAALVLLLFFINGCSEEKTQIDADKRDHVLRQQIDVMNDAASVTQTLNQNTKAQDEQAAQIAGH